MGNNLTPTTFVEAYFDDKIKTLLAYKATRLQQFKEFSENLTKAGFELVADGYYISINKVTSKNVKKLDKICYKFDFEYTMRADDCSSYNIDKTKLESYTNLSITLQLETDFN